MKKYLEYLIPLVTILVVVIVLNSYLNKINDKLETINKIVSFFANEKKVIDTVYITLPVDNVKTSIDYKKLFYLLDSAKEIDTVYIKNNIESDKPTFGNISFFDSTNNYVNIYGSVDWPYGQTKLTYINKYVDNKYRVYIGGSFIDKCPYITFYGTKGKLLINLNMTYDKKIKFYLGAGYKIW